MPGVFLFYIFLFVFWAEVVLNLKLSPIVGLSFLNATLYVMLFTWLLLGLRDRRLIEANRVNKYFVALLTVVIISIPLKLVRAEIPGISLNDELVSLKGFLNPFLIFFFLFNCLDNEKHCRWAMGGLLAFLALTVFTTIGAATGMSITGAAQTWSRAGRAAGFVEPNQFAAFVVLFIPLLISGTFFFKTFLKKTVFGAILFFTIVSLFVSGSRGGFIAMLFGISIYCLLLFRKDMVRMHTLLFIGIIALPLLVVSAFMMAPDDVRESVTERFDLRQSEDAYKLTSGRTVLWSNSFQIFLQRPILGHGQNTVTTLMRQNFSIWGNSHNDYLSYLVHFGFIGFTLFMMLLWALFQEAKPVYDNSPDILMKLISISYIAGLAGYALAMFSVNVIQPRILFWAYSAVIIKYGRIHLQDK